MSNGVPASLSFYPHPSTDVVSLMGNQHPLLAIVTFTLKFEDVLYQFSTSSLTYSTRNVGGYDKAVRELGGLNEKVFWKNVNQ